MSHGWLGHGWLRREQHLRKKPHQNQTNKVWDCENQAELPHVLPLYHSPNLSEIYSKNYAFPLPPPFLVEVLVFLYLGTEDTLSVNLYGFLAVLYYSCSSEIPQLGPAFPQEIFSCSDLYSKWPQHFRKAKTMQLLTSFLYYGQGFSCHLENSFMWLDIHVHGSTQPFASRQAGHVFAHTPHWSKSYGNAITRCWVATNIIYFSKTLISWAQPCTRMTALDPTWSWLVLGQFRAQYFLKTGLTFHPIGFWLLLTRFIRFR